MDRNWTTFTQFLQNWLQVFLRLKLFLLERCVRNIDFLSLGWHKLLGFLRDVFCIGIHQLTFIIFDEQFKSSRAIASTLSTWMGRNSHNSDTVKLTKFVILVLF